MSENAAALRRTWRNMWLSCLRESADADLQQQMWLDPRNKNPHWSYIEFMCSYFDDTFHGSNYDLVMREGLVTESEAATVAALHQLPAAYEAPNGNDFDNSAILQDPAWTAIVTEAEQVRKRLASFLVDPAERDILLRDSDTTLR